MGSFAVVEHLTQAPRKPFLEISTSVRESDNSKYVYHMNLELSSTYPSGSNKIIWRSYTSTKPNGDLPTSFPIEQMGNFMFSRVKSYS